MYKSFSFKAIVPLVLCFMLSIFISYTAFADPLDWGPYEYTQPNGEVIMVYGYGDEWFSWYENDAGYIIEPIYDSEADATYWYYAKIENDTLVPGENLVGINDEIADYMIHRTSSEFYDLYYTRINTLGSGTCENLSWSIDKNGTLTISGSGDMVDFSSSSEYASPPWLPYKSSIVSVVIENGVTSVGANAFSDFGYITSVSLPNGLAKIGMYAFSGCSGLTEITLPNSITSIGEAAFQKSGLEHITIPSAVTEISANTFDHCTSLKSIYFPKSVKQVDELAFYSCCGIEVSYEGTADEWGLISFESNGNEPVIAADVSYLSLKTPNVTLTQDTDIIHISIDEAYENGYLYAVGYNVRGALITSAKSDLGETAANLTAFDDIKTIKVFIWDENMQPLTKAWSQAYAVSTLEP